MELSKSWKRLEYHVMYRECPNILYNKVHALLMSLTYMENDAQGNYY